jgi:miniconductance mechanosensitive channel
MLLTGIFVLNSLLNAVGAVYRDFEISRQRPIRGYIQIAKIILFIFISLVAISVILDRSPWLLLSGFGAMTAVVILVFKDTILGLVASIQLSANNMVQIDDWIEMPKYGANGPVIDITLHTVKVRNWDKTITTIPTYALISDAFVNWRGMTESGGRRMKRSVHIDMTSVKFCDEAMLQRFRKFQYLDKYLDSKLAEIEEYNRTHEADLTEVINGRRLTNLGTFRAYIWAYLENHPMIHKDLTYMVRHLAPGPEGIPIEIYAFSTDQRWTYYESIQADIFDHILAVIPEFELRVFQRPTGSDVQRLAPLTTGPARKEDGGGPEGPAVR